MRSESTVSTLETDCTSHRRLEQVGNLPLQDGIGLEPYGVAEAFLFQQSQRLRPARFRCCRGRRRTSPAQAQEAAAEERLHGFGRGTGGWRRSASCPPPRGWHGDRGHREGGQRSLQGARGSCQGTTRVFGRANTTVENIRDRETAASLQAGAAAQGEPASLATLQRMQRAANKMRQMGK
jgi:hypothetical protein